MNDTIVQDFVHGSRIFRRRPGLLISVVLLLGLTTGATVTLMGLTDRILLRPLAVSSPERLVQVIRPALAGGYPEESFPSVLCDRLHEASGSSSDLFVVGFDDFATASTDGFAPETVKAAYVGADAFAALDPSWEVM